MRQFVTLRGAPSALKGKEEDTSFMLKTKRLEYTFEFFRSQLFMQLDDTSKMTLKDRADQNFVSELRFLTTRMIAASYLIGV